MLMEALVKIIFLFMLCSNLKNSEEQGVERVYIISRKSDSIPEVSEELKVLGINDRGMFDKMGISIDNILKRGIYKRLEAYAVEAPELVPLTYVWIPDFQADFLMFNFGKLKEQYDLTSQWAKTHNPVPIAEYLLPHLLKRVRSSYSIK